MDYVCQAGLISLCPQLATSTYFS